MIRKATPEDINIINILGSKFKDNFSTTYDINNYLENDNYIILLNEDIVINAFMIIYKNIDYYELEAIYVSDDSRNKGIASSILNHFFNKFKPNEILLEVAVNNISALNLYKKFGFEIINVRKKYYNGIDAYVMKKVM